MTRKIVWKKWRDPFEPDEIKDGIEEEDEEEKSEWEDSYDSLENNNRSAHVTGPFIVGPMGIIPVKEGARPSKLYNFWMMHTNFNITRKVEKVLSDIEGVETLDVFSRYRGRLAIGEVFEEDVVKKEIETILLKEPEPKFIAPSKTDDLLTQKLNTKYKFWAILELENKQTKIVGSNDSKQNVSQTITEYPNAKIKQSSWKE